MSEKNSTHSSKKGSHTPLAKYALIVLVIGVALFVVFNGTAFLQSFNSAPVSTPTAGAGDITPDDISTPGGVDTQLLKTTLSKEKFLKQLYTFDRDTYNLFEKAAVHLNLSLTETKQFFYNCCDLASEADIFAQLPPVPEDFPAVAYDVATGKIYQIGLLSGGYYKQPEFYSFVDQETGIVNREFALRPWSKPQLDQWGDNGFQVYPANQYDALSLSGRKTFSAVVFVTNGWNIQNFVGINLVANKQALDYFDLKVAEESTGQPYFKLGPTFPYFHKDWATKVTIEGTLKPNTPAGDYVITLNPTAPPKELNSKWLDEHSGLYASYGFVYPSDGYINLGITVTP